MAFADLLQIRDAGFAVPSDPPLADLTAELTRLLGDPDPALRDGLALPVLATWVERGVYDDLLAGLGDGMCAGLRAGLGEAGTPSVFRRSFSALVLAECVERDAARGLLAGGTVLQWGDRVVTWLLAERDLRGWVPRQGWAHAVAHGADAVGTLAGSPHLGEGELVVLLDVLAERVTADDADPLVAGEPDRLAAAALRVLRREKVRLDTLETWVDRLRAAARPRRGGESDPFRRTGNAEAFLRALYLQLSLGSPAPGVRADLLLVLVEALRRTNPAYLAVRRTPIPVPPTFGGV